MSAATIDAVAQQVSNSEKDESMQRGLLDDWEASQRILDGDQVWVLVP